MYAHVCVCMRVRMRTYVNVCCRHVPSELKGAGKREEQHLSTYVDVCCRAVPLIRRPFYSSEHFSLCIGCQFVLLIAPFYRTGRSMFFCKDIQAAALRLAPFCRTVRSIILRAVVGGVG